MKELGAGIGTALSILAICFGIGGCTYLEHLGAAKTVEAKAKLMETEAKVKMMDMATEKIAAKEKEDAENPFE